MSTQKHKKGYIVVSLSKFGVRKSCKVHRCVYSAFHGPIPQGMQVNHMNEDKADNRLENLNLLTNKENCNWGNYGINQSERLKKAVLQFDLCGNFVKEWKSGIDIQAITGYDSSCVSKCCRGEIKTAYGSIWKYKEKAG